jgi:hypothetical protein
MKAALTLWQSPTLEKACGSRPIAWLFRYISMACAVTVGTIGHSCQSRGERRVSVVTVGSGAAVGATMVSGGGAIGEVGLGEDGGWLLVETAVPSPLIGATQPHRNKISKIREQILCMRIFSPIMAGWLRPGKQNRGPARQSGCAMARQIES